MLTTLSDFRHLVSCVCSAPLNETATGFAESKMLLQWESSSSLQTQPPDFTSMVGAPVNTAPNSDGNDQCRFDRGINFPNPKLAMNPGELLCMATDPVPASGVDPVAAFAFAE